MVIFGHRFRWIERAGARAASVCPFVQIRESERAHKRRSSFNSISGLMNQSGLRQLMIMMINNTIFCGERAHLCFFRALVVPDMPSVGLEFSNCFRFVPVSLDIVVNDGFHPIVDDVLTLLSFDRFEFKY